MSKMTSLLVTGGAGFIGSNFIHYLLEKYDNYRVINLDALTYAGDLDNLKAIESNPNYQFVHGNICDRELVNKLFSEHDIRGVIHFAAESHVDNSINGPGIFFETNVLGTQILLEAAYKHWMYKPFSCKEGYESARFHHISTDEVYGSLGDTGAFTEESPHRPNSPYSASKSASDMVVRSYHKTYGLNTTTTNCSNNYGPHQHAEKFIPTVIRCALAEQSIPIYGSGKNVRDWMYVGDHCKAIDAVFHLADGGDIFNVGGNCEYQNIEMAHIVCRGLDKLHPRKSGHYEQLICSVKDRAGHDHRYAIDNSKFTEYISDFPHESFEDKILGYIGESLIALAG
jgi:dTDP-glucose 4,6-dehydratase